jgi:predicted nucleic acid-binding protein
MKALIDTHAWISYFEGDEKGRTVADIVDNPKNELFTTDIVIGEVFSWCLREDVPFNDLISVIKGKAKILECYLNIWIEAHAMRHKIREKHSDFGIADATLLAMQQHTKATIITGDPHFKDLPKVVFVG